VSVNVNQMSGFKIRTVDRARAMYGAKVARKMGSFIQYDPEVWYFHSAVRWYGLHQRARARVQRWPSWDTLLVERR